MRAMLLGGVLAMVLVPAVQPQPATALDPVGKWAVQTKDEDGSPIAATMEITGQPGNYKGTVTVTGVDQQLPITDVTTSNNAIVLFATMPDGGTAVVKIWKAADGKLQCLWAPVKQTIPGTIEKAGKLE